jgi:hypothetical protein
MIDALSGDNPDDYDAGTLDLDAMRRNARQRGPVVFGTAAKPPVRDEKHHLAIFSRSAPMPSTMTDRHAAHRTDGKYRGLTEAEIHAIRAARGRFYDSDEEDDEGGVEGGGVVEKAGKAEGEAERGPKEKERDGEVGGEKVKAPEHILGEKALGDPQTSTLSLRERMKMRLAASQQQK